MKEMEYFDMISRKWEENITKRGLPARLVYPFGKAPITSYLAKRAQESPDRPAVIFYGRSITYRELDDLSNKFANYLIDQGYGKGDFIAIHLFNCPQYLIAHFGGMKAGCTVIPLDPVWKEIELEVPLEDTGVSLIVTQDINYPVIGKLREKFGLKHVLTAAFREFLPAETALPFPKDLDAPARDCPGAVGLMQAIEGCSSSPPEVDLKLEDAASLDYTGGTTGMSKGCMHDHLGVIYTRSCMYTYFGFSKLEGQPILEFVPIFHTAGRGLMEAAVFSGMTNVLLARFDLAATLAGIDRYRAATMWAPSDVYDGITKLPPAELQKYNLTSMKYGTCTQYNVTINGGLRRKWSDITGGGVVYDITYGLTETLSMNTIVLGLQDVDLKKQEENGGVFIGLPMPETRIKIVDTATRELVPPKTVGEIAIKDPALSRAYFKRPEENEKCYLPDRFLLTGDLGMYDEDGFFYYKGRTKEIIKVSGFTVSPREIELILGQHPAIKGVAVVGIPDARLGEMPVAFVVPKLEDSGLDVEELGRWCREKMAGYKAPRHFFVKEALPLIMGLKVDRERLKREAGELISSS